MIANKEGLIRMQAKIYNKDHSQFIALISAKIVKFSNQMVQILLNNHNSNSNTKENLGNSQESYEQNSKQDGFIRKQVQLKRKYLKGRTRLAIDSNGQRPKAPTSSFLIYYHKNKKALSAKFGESNVSRLTKLASLVWKQLPEEEKMEYQKISDESKERYQKQMVAFKAKYASQIEQALKKRRAEYRLNWLNKKRQKQVREISEKQNNSIRSEPK